MVSANTSVANTPVLIPPTVHRNKDDTINKKVVQRNTAISAYPSASKYATVTATVLPPVLSAALINSGVPPSPAVSMSTNNTPTSSHLTFKTALNRAGAREGLGPTPPTFHIVWEVEPGSEANGKWESEIQIINVRPKVSMIGH